MLLLNESGTEFHRLRPVFQFFCRSFQQRTHEKQYFFELVFCNKKFEVVANVELLHFDEVFFEERLKVAESNSLVWCLAWHQTIVAFHKLPSGLTASSPCVCECVLDGEHRRKEQRAASEQ